MKGDAFALENELRISYVPAAKDQRKFITATAVSSGPVDRILADPYLTSWQADEICRVFKDVLKVDAAVTQSKFDTVFKTSSP